MKKVRREEILDYVTWSEQKPQVMAKILETKERRRIHVGKYLTFLFENADTIRYQIQEMIRVEQMVKDADIRHEIETYNEILGSDGELGCTLMIEIDDKAERDVKLRQWLDLPGKLYVKLEDGTRVTARFDERQQNDEKVSSVQFLHFATGGKVPVAIGSDHPGLKVEQALSEGQKQALREDLAG